jgi:hypothetical protein
VTQDDQVLPHHAQNVDGQGRFQLLDEALGSDENRACIVQHAGDEQPDDEADREVGKIGRNVQIEQAPVQRAHPGDEGAGADRQPERTQHRAPIALLDLEPSQHRPDVDARNSLNEVLRRERKTMAPGDFHGTFGHGAHGTIIDPDTGCAALQ